MTNDEIKKLALRYGFTERQQADGTTGLNLYVYAFANALIDITAKKEREACANVCEGMHEEDRPGDYADAIRSRSKT